MEIAHRQETVKSSEETKPSWREDLRWTSTPAPACLLHPSLTLFPSSTSSISSSCAASRPIASLSAPPSSATSVPSPDEAVSPSSTPTSGCRKRFSLQGFGKTTKGAPVSPDRTRSQSLKTEASPFGFRGWAKASLSVDASEEQEEEFSSGEEPVTSDPEDEDGKKQSPATHTVTTDCERAGPQELSVKAGDLVQLIREGEAGQWFVKDLRSATEGWVSSAILQALPSQSLTSSDGSVSGNLSTSTSYSESYTSYSDIRP